jgi:hypothetical protein
MSDEGTLKWVRSASKLFEEDEQEEARYQSQRYSSLRVSTDEEPTSFVDIEGLIERSYSPKVWCPLSLSSHSILL